MQLRNGNTRMPGSWILKVLGTVYVERAKMTGILISKVRAPKPLLRGASTSNATMHDRIESRFKRNNV